MNDDDIPEEIRFHPEGYPGGFLWQAAREGAWKFGYHAVRADGTGDGDLYPLNWPGGRPADCEFMLAAEWPDGRTRMAPLHPMEEEQPGGEDDPDIRAARFLLDGIPEWMASPDRDHHLRAHEVRSLLPDDMEEAEPAVLRAFLAGYKFNALQESQWISHLQTSLEKARSARSNPFLDSAKLAIKLKGHKGALALLGDIGAVKAEEKASDVWRNWQGVEIDQKQWELAVKSAAR